MYIFFKIIKKSIKKYLFVDIYGKIKYYLIIKLIRQLSLRLSPFISLLMVYKFYFYLFVYEYVYSRNGRQKTSELFRCFFLCKNILC